MTACRFSVAAARVGGCSRFHYLRDTLGLTGTHVGCDTSNCGACTVLLDGKSVKSCTLLAVQADGCNVTTVEALDPASASYQAR